MKILLVSPFNPIGFAEYFDTESRCRLKDNHVNSSSINALVKGLLVQDHRLTIVAIQEYTTECVHLHGDRLDVYLASGLKKSWQWILPTWYVWVMNMRKIVKHEVNKVDVIHSQWCNFYTYSVLPFVAKKPTFCTVRDWQPLLKQMQSFKGRLDEMYHDFMFWKIMSCRQISFVANSQYTADRLQTVFPSRTFPIIPNSVREEFLLQGDREYPKEIRLLSIQQRVDDERKNLRTLLTAFRQIIQLHPDARLQIVGEYAMEPDSIYGQTVQLGIAEHVEFLGKQSHLALIPLLDNASALVHSALEETFGNIFLEAFGRKLPVIGGDKSGAVPALLGHGQYGVLCNVCSADALSDAILSVHDGRVDKNKMVQNAYDNLLANYTEQAVAISYVHLYQNTIAINS